MSALFRSMRGLPARPALSVISRDHADRLQAWLDAQPRRVDRRKARRIVLGAARQTAERAQQPFSEGLETVLYQLEMEAAQLQARRQAVSA